MSDVMRSYDRSKEMGNRKRVVMSTRQRGEGSSSEQNEEKRKKRREEGERKKHAEWVASIRNRKMRSGSWSSSKTPGCVSVLLDLELND